MDEPRHGLAKGYTIEGYRVDRVLGAGGFGITYLATEIAIERPVAIKEYLPAGIAARARNDVSVQPLTSGDHESFQWGLERFKREAQTLVAFQHPNIVSVYRFFEANGTAYLVMGYEDGDSLASILEKKKTLDEETIRSILEPLLSGLEHVHKAGFLHRDIKPGNIYMRKNGSPVLLDFGAARLAVGARSQSLTSIVSAGYAPFEQYTTRGNQGPWTDIYALGGVLYRAAVGQRPPDAPDRIRNDPIVPAAKAAAKNKYSPGLLAAIDAALIVDEDQRPQSLAQWRPVFEGAPWPPEEGAPAVEERPPSKRGDATASQGQATLVVGAEPGSRGQRSAASRTQRDVATGHERDNTRWPTGARSATQATQPPVTGEAGRPARSGAAKWVIIGGLAVGVLAVGGVGAALLIPGPGLSVADQRAAAEKLKEAEAALARGDILEADRLAQEVWQRFGFAPGYSEFKSKVHNAAFARAKASIQEARAAVAQRDRAAAERALDIAEKLVVRFVLQGGLAEQINELKAEIARMGGSTTTTSGSWPADPEFRKAVDDTIRKLVPDGR